MDPELSAQAKNFSPSSGIINFIVTGFLGIMGSIAILNGIFSLMHIWFGRFDGQSMRVGRSGNSLGWMDDVPQSLFILGVGLFFRGIIRLRKQARRQNRYRSHRPLFRIGLIIVMILGSRGAYRGIIAAEGGSGIYAAQSCDTDTIRDLHTKGTIADTDKNEMMMRMAQRGCDESLSYVLDQGWDINTTYKDTPIVNTAGSFGTTKAIMTLIDHGANVNSMDHDISLIMRVLQNSNITISEKRSIIRKLIEKGVNLDYSTPDGVLSVEGLAKSYGVDLSNL